MKKQKVEIENPNEIATKVIADSIVDIAQSMKKLSSTRLSRDAIVVLIQDESGYGKNMINRILDNLENLEALWLKKKV